MLRMARRSQYFRKKNVDKKRGTGRVVLAAWTNGIWVYQLKPRSAHSHTCARGRMEGGGSGKSNEKGQKSELAGKRVNFQWTDTEKQLQNLHCCTALLHL